MEALMQAWFSGPPGKALVRLGNMSAAACVLIVIVILLRLALRRAPKWTRGILWAIVAVQLICPVTLRSPLSVYSLLPRSGAVNSEQAEVFRAGGGSEKPLLILDAPQFARTAPAAQAEQAPVAPENAAAAPVKAEASVYLPTAGTVWLAGLALMLLYALVSWLTLRRRVRASVPAEASPFRICDGIDTPFILGILRPRVYLPSGLSDAQRKAVIAHETAHLRRRDHWWKPLGWLLLSVHWFNPLVWLAYVLLCRDIELACDEKAVRDMDGAARADYSQALLDCAAPRTLVRACPLAFGETGIKARIKAVLNYKKPAFWIIVLAVAACAVVAVCFLTRPASDQKEEAPPVAVTPTPEKPAETTPTSDPIITDGFRLDMEHAKTYFLGEEYYPDSDDPFRSFSITLDMESGCFQYYETPISSLFGLGVFKLDGDVLTLDDSRFVNRFRMEDGGERLVWIAEGSDNFLFVKLADGAVFSLDHTPIAPLTLYSGVYEGQYFSIRIDAENGSYRFSEADYSSHLATGFYGLDGDILTIEDTWPTESGEPAVRTNRFRVEPDRIVWLEEGSDNFVFVKLTDGASFVRRGPENAVRRMTIEDVNKLAAKGTALTWDDLLGFEGEDVGSGLYIYRFPIARLEKQFCLEASDAKLSGKPARVRLLAADADGVFHDMYDIRDPSLGISGLPVYKDDSMLIVESGGQAVAPYPIFLYGQTWFAEANGWLSADGIPVELAIREHADEIPTLTLKDGDLSAACRAGRKWLGNMRVYDEHFTLLRSNWYGYTALHWLAPGTYYCGIDVRGPVGTYIEEADDFEESAYCCVFRVIVSEDGPAPYTPEAVRDLTKATLRLAGTDYPLTDDASLSQLEEWFGNAEQASSDGRSAPYNVLLTLTRADGGALSLFLTDDGPGYIFADGQHYRFDGDRAALYGMFGIQRQ